MTAIPFSQALRERTRPDHSESEGANFMDDLMKGKGTREDYIALVVQHYYVYEALERAAELFAGNPEAAPFITPELTRMPALEGDLEFLLGDDWRDQIEPLPTTVRYVDRINEIAAEGWAGGFIAHHYTRYLGDLSGGQIIRTLMQRQFGFENDGVLFYIFDGIKPREFKESYREQLDAVGWSDEEQQRVVDEVVLAYRLNTELFIDLSAAKAAA
jgi:heme oxygenase